MDINHETNRSGPDNRLDVKSDVEDDASAIVKKLTVFLQFLELRGFSQYVMHPEQCLLVPFRLIDNGVAFKRRKSR